MPYLKSTTRILSRLITCGLTAALAACAPPFIVSSHPVPEPAAELAASRALVQAQYPLLNQMACLSEAAYGVDPAKPDPRCAAFVQAPGVQIIPRPVPLQDIWGKPYQGSYSIIIDNPQHRQVIAVRGSDDLNDWLTDFRFKPVLDDILQVPVHQGFQLYAEAVLNDLLNNGGLRLLNPAYDTYVAGHSLGGAVGLLVGLYFYVGYPNTLAIKGVYTYGQPKVFDNHGATSWPNFANGVYHVENCFDPVPLLPIGNDVFTTLVVDPLSSRSEAAQYQHIGHEIVLLGTGSYWLPGANELVRNTVADTEAAITALKAGHPTDHDIGLYITGIQSLSPPGGFAWPVNPAYQFLKTCTYRPVLS